LTDDIKEKSSISTVSSSEDDEVASEVPDKKDDQTSLVQEKAQLI